LEYSLEQKLKKSLQVAQSSRMALMMQHEANNDVKYALKQLIDGVLPCF
jgi:phosphosulfolactate phosphohydrolase-like enzyme